jgi:hypothetical protein
MNTLLNLDFPKNHKVLKYLKEKGVTYTSIIQPPESVKNPYFNQGSHPDIVERVWKIIGKDLPLDCRQLVYGTPCLLNPVNGIIFAICNGTQYNLQLTGKDFLVAKEYGLKTTTKWSSGKIMDSVEQLGENWIFGGWKDLEKEWGENYYNESNQ